MGIDLTHLQLSQIIVTLFAITFLDWVAGVAGAVRAGTFTLDRIAEFLVTHVVGRVIPLSFAAALGLGVPQAGIPAITPIFGIFLLGAAAYVAETLASIAKNLGAPSPPEISTGATDGPDEEVTP